MKRRENTHIEPPHTMYIHLLSSYIMTAVLYVTLVPTWMFCLHLLFYLFILWLPWCAPLYSSVTYTLCHRVHWLKSPNPPWAHDPYNEHNVKCSRRELPPHFTVMTTSWPHAADRNRRLRRRWGWSFCKPWKVFWYVSVIRIGVQGVSRRETFLQVKCEAQVPN